MKLIFGFVGYCAATALGEQQVLQVQSTIQEGNLLETIHGHQRLSLFSQLIEERVELASALTAVDADLTVFAPSDEALSSIPGSPSGEEITAALLYHLVKGVVTSDSFSNGLLLNTSYAPDKLGGNSQKIRVSAPHGIVLLNGHTHIEESDVIATNGVIHLTDRVLLFPPSALTVMAHFPLHYGAYLLALRRGGLVDTVKATEGLTIFAPTTLAFKHLGWRVLIYLFSSQGKQHLKEILQYSLCPTLAYSPDFVPGVVRNLSSLLGDKQLQIVSELPEEGDDLPLPTVTLVINGVASSVHVDALTSNGVIHVINAVLLPFKYSDLLNWADEWRHKHHTEANAIMNDDELLFLTH